VDEFTQAVNDVEEKCSTLLNSPRYALDSLPRSVPQSGIYMFSEGGLALYVGRTNKMRNRLRYHTASNHNQATFAFLLAREETGKKATYKKLGFSQRSLERPGVSVSIRQSAGSNPSYGDSVYRGEGPKRQALLEICAALRAGAKYNDFDNH